MATKAEFEQMNADERAEVKMEALCNCLRMTARRLFKRVHDHKRLIVLEAHTDCSESRCVFVRLYVDHVGGFGKARLCAGVHACAQDGTADRSKTLRRDPETADVEKLAREIALVAADRLLGVTAANDYRATPEQIIDLATPSD